MVAVRSKATTECAVESLLICLDSLPIWLGSLHVRSQVPEVGNRVERFVAPCSLLQRIGNG